MIYTRPLATWHTFSSAINWEWIPHWTKKVDNDATIIWSRPIFVSLRDVILAQARQAPTELPETLKTGGGWTTNFSENCHVHRSPLIPFSILWSSKMQYNIKERLIGVWWETQSDNDHVIRKMYDIQFMKLSTLQEIFKLDYFSLLKQSYLQYFLVFSKVVK